VAAVSSAVVDCEQQGDGDDGEADVERGSDRELVK
jgi:hypothetical protein